MSIPVFALEYSIGVKLIIKFFPSLPIGASSPVLGITENSGALSGRKLATKGENYLYLFDNLNETLVV